jgi:hypothetical protein
LSPLSPYQEKNMPRNIRALLTLVLTIGSATASAAQTTTPITLPYLVGYAVVAFNVVLVLAWVVMRLNKRSHQGDSDESGDSDSPPHDPAQ